MDRRWPNAVLTVLLMVVLTSCDDDDDDGGGAPPGGGTPPGHAITLTAPATLAEGDGTVACTIDITPAPATGTTINVTLASNDSAVVVPGNVVVDETGTQSFDMTVRSDDDAYQGTYDVSVDASGPDCAPGAATVTVVDDELGRIIVAVPADTATEGDADLTTCTVDVFPAPTGSDTVDVAISSDQADVTVIDTLVTVDSSGPVNFRLRFRSDNGTYEADAVATIAGLNVDYEEGTDAITLTDDELGEITVTVPTTVAEGEINISCSVTVFPAPTSGTVTVSLSSDSPSHANPSIGSVAVGASGSASFFLTARADNATYEADIDVSILATCSAYVSGLDMTTVQDDELGAISVTVPANATEGDTGVQGTVTITPAPASGTVTVDLESDATAHVAPAAASVDVDTSGTATFDLDIRADDSGFTPDVLATITASNTSYESGTDTITVTDDELGQIRVFINGATAVAEGTGTVAGKGTIAVNAPGVADGVVVTVDVNSSIPLGATVPPTVAVTIDKGAGSTDFAITFNDNAYFTGDLVVTISGSCTAYESDSDTVTVTDDEVGAITITVPSSATEGGTGVLGTVDITAPQVANGTIVTVSLDSDVPSAASVPATVNVLVNGGSGSASFNITIRGDNGTYQPDATVTIGGSSATYQSGSDTMTVVDNELGVITVVIPPPNGATEGDPPVPSQIIIGAPGVSDGTVVAVSLDSSSPSDATVPATVDVTINSGTGNASFNITIVDDAIADGEVMVTVTGTSLNYQGGSDVIRVFDDD